MSDINRVTAEMMELDYEVYDGIGGERIYISRPGKRDLKWNPREDIAQAMMVAEWARSKGWDVRIQGLPGFDWSCQIEMYPHSHEDSAKTLEKFPLAICTAVIEAVEGRKE